MEVCVVNQSMKNFLGGRSSLFRNLWVIKFWPSGCLSPRMHYGWGYYLYPFFDLDNVLLEKRFQSQNIMWLNMNKNTNHVPLLRKSAITAPELRNVKFFTQTITWVQNFTPKTRNLRLICIRDKTRKSW